MSVPETPPIEKEPKPADAPPEEKPPVEPEVTPETPTEPEEPPQKTTDEIIAELKAENEKLKAGKEPEPEEKKESPARVPNQNLKSFETTFIPQAKKFYVGQVKEDGTVDHGAQFDAIVRTQENFIMATLADRIAPMVEPLIKSNIEMRNELTIRDMRDNPTFKSVEARVRTTLSKLPLEQQERSGIITEIFHRIVGERAASGKPISPVAKPAGKPASVVSQLKDISGGGGNGGGSAGAVGKVTLTSEQEKDRQEMEEEGGYAISKEEYHAKLKARQETAKASGRKKIPTILTGF